MRHVKISGVNAGSPHDWAIQDYFTAVEAQDYRTARVCMINILHDGPNDPRVLAEIIRKTHEMEPPA